MDKERLAVDIASAFTMTSGLLFVISYALLARWWRSTDGRMIMGFVALIVNWCAIDLGTKGPDYVRAAAIACLGLLILIYTIRVWISQFKGRKETKEQ